MIIISSIVVLLFITIFQLLHVLFYDYLANKLFIAMKHLDIDLKSNKSFKLLTESQVHVLIFSEYFINY